MKRICSASFLLIPTSWGSFPCGKLVLALAGITVMIHLLGHGWGHLVSSLDTSLGEN